MHRVRVINLDMVSRDILFRMRTCAIKFEGNFVSWFDLPAPVAKPGVNHLAVFIEAAHFERRGCDCFRRVVLDLSHNVQIVVPAKLTDPLAA